MRIKSRKFKSLRLGKEAKISFYIDQGTPTKLVFSTDKKYLIISFDTDEEVKQLISIAHKIAHYRE